MSKFLSLQLTCKRDLKCWCCALYLLHKKVNNHESRLDLFGWINQQCTTYMSLGRAGTHDHRIGSQAPYPSRRKVDKHIKLNVLKNIIVFSVTFA